MQSKNKNLQKFQERTVVRGTILVHPTFYSIFRHERGPKMNKKALNLKLSNFSRATEAK